MATGPNGCLGARAPILVEQDGRSDPVNVTTLHHFWEDKLAMGLATLLILVQFLHVPVSILFFIAEKISLSLSLRFLW